MRSERTPCAGYRFCKRNGKEMQSNKTTMKVNILNGGLLRLLLIAAPATTALPLQAQTDHVHGRGGAPDGSEFALSILHVNDIHSRLEDQSFSVASSDLPLEIVEVVGEDGVDVTYGGYPRLVTLFDQLEVEALAEGDAVIRLHAGDALTGSLYYSAYDYVADADLMQYVCFDAFEFGNHEFDDGDINLAGFVNEILYNSPVCNKTKPLMSNLIPGNDSPLKPLVDSGEIGKYQILNVEGGQQIGVIGVNVRNKTLTSSSPDDGTNILDEKESVMQYVAELEAMGVNKIVVLSHAGYGLDNTYLAPIEGVDVIIGGDSHTLLGGEEVTIVGEPKGPFPTLYESATGITCIYQAWEYGHGIGNARIVFNENGEVVSCGGETVFPFDGVSFDPPIQDAATAQILSDFLESAYSLVANLPDEAATQALAVYKDELDLFQNEVIADVPELICHERKPGSGYSAVCPIEETILQGGGVCNLVNQAWLAGVKLADISISNAGGCRTDIQAGDFTVGNGYTMLPFKDTLVLFELTGAEVKQLLEDLAVRYPYGAGIRFDFYDGNPEGEHFQNIEINRRLEQDTWVPLDLEATYKVVTVNFLAEGGDGVEILPELSDRRTDLFLDYAEVFNDYVRKVGILTDPPREEYSTQFFSEEAQPGGPPVPTTEAPGVPPTEAPAGTVPAVPTTEVPVEPPTDAPSTSAGPSTVAGGKTVWTTVHSLVVLVVMAVVADVVGF